MEPLVSEPMAKGTRPAATAAAGPLEEPPDQRARSHGLSPGPKSEAAVDRSPPPPASSTMESLPTITEPTLLSLSITLALKSNTDRKSTRLNSSHLGISYA